MLDSLEHVKDNDALVRKVGTRIVTDMCRKVESQHFHFYTLNLETAVRDITSALVDATLATAQKRLPFRARKDEDVRPCHWANRTKSYLYRTEKLGGVSGRWADTHTSCIHQGSLKLDDNRKEWGDRVTSLDEVAEVFAAYVEGKIGSLPWCEESLHIETLSISARLARYNRAGLLSINSQPAVNGADSEDTKFGWGGSGGLVYQKSYVEFFVSPDMLASLMDTIKKKSLVFHATDRKGNTYTNSSNPNSCTAVTWGVFPGREVIQPTVVDAATFTGPWAQESFQLWSEWAKLYKEDSPTRQFLEDCGNTFFLVNIVDNESFLRPAPGTAGGCEGIFELFEEVCGGEEEGAGKPREVVEGNLEASRKVAPDKMLPLLLLLHMQRTALHLPRPTSGTHFLPWLFPARWKITLHNGP